MFVQVDLSTRQVFVGGPNGSRVYTIRIGNLKKIVISRDWRAGSSFNKPWAGKPRVGPLILSLSADQSGPYCGQT